MLRIKAHEFCSSLQRSDFVFLAVACGSLGLDLVVVPGQETLCVHFDLLLDFYDISDVFAITKVKL